LLLLLLLLELLYSQTMLYSVGL